MDKQTRDQIIRWLSRDRRDDRIERLARWMSRSLHIGGLAACRALIYEALATPSTVGRAQ